MMITGNTGIGRIDGGRRRRGIALDDSRPRFLRMRKRRVIGMRREPIVDELLDGLAPPERRLDEVAASLRVEILEQLRLACVTCLALLDLGLDLVVRDDYALCLGNLRQDEEDADPSFGVRSEVGVEVG